MDATVVTERALSVLGYPRPVRPLVNRFSDGATLEVAPSVEIAPGCLLRGEIDLESAADVPDGRRRVRPRPTAER